MHVIGIEQCSYDYLAVDQYPPVDTKKEVLSWHEQGGGPVAALKCTRIGGRTGIPSLDETLDFLRAKGITLGQKQQ